MTSQKLNLETAIHLLHDHMKNQNLRRHCYSVGKALAAYYDYYTSINLDVGKLTKDEWEVAGILHDADWEETTNNASRHTLETLNWLKEYETPVEILDTLRSHNNKITQLKEPESLLEWTLECCDELTGFIVAVALVMPEKKLDIVSVDRVLKKMNQKEFARAVDRTQITQCETKLGIDIETFVGITLKAMQENHELLGL